jgi:hypothetical protein
VLRPEHQFGLMVFRVVRLVDRARAARARREPYLRQPSAAGILSIWQYDRQPDFVPYRRCKAVNHDNCTPLYTFKHLYSFVFIYNEAPPV